MKRFFRNNHGRAALRARRALAIVLVLALTLAFGASALADGGKAPSGGQTPGGQQRGGSGGQTDMQTPGGANTGNGQQGGAPGGQPDEAGVNVDSVREAIEALEDETAKENLLTLLDAYETALDAKQAAITSKDTTDLSTLSQAAADAKDALEAAMTEAGLSLDDILGTKDAPQDGTGRQNGQPELDTDAIAEAIAALDDTDTNKATLQSLLEAYETALAAEESADTTALTEDELTALSDATDAARQALQEALKSTGMNEEALGDAQEPQQNENGETNQWRMTVVSDGENAQDSSTGLGFLKTIYNWLSSLFGTQD